MLDEGLRLISERDPVLKVEAVLIDARPADSLVELALQRQARAIVVGHRGMGPIRGAVLGSVTYRILHSAPCPVVVVKEPQH